MNITEYFLKKPTLGNLITVLVILMGILIGFNLNRATYPNVNFDILKIVTKYPGATSKDVEINVTNKIEEKLNDVQGIDRFRSVSLENVSLIYVFVDLNEPDREKIKDDIRRAVDQVTNFPAGVDERPLVDEIRSTNVAVIELAVLGNVDESQKRAIVLDLKEQIDSIPGVANVEKIGYRKREVKILANAQELRDKYLSLLDIYQTIKNRNIHTSGGSITSFSDSQKVVTFSEFEKPEDVSDVILRSNYSGKQIFLKDVAKIENGYEKAEVLTRTRGNESINLLIRAQSSADIIDISHEVRRIIDSVKPNLPKGLEIDIVSDFSYYTASLLSIVKNNAYIGFVLVLVCLMVFLTKMNAVWTAFGIPLSVFGSICFFPLFGISINFISMITMILTLGLIVDDAIVISESITRHMEMGKNKMQAALDGSREVFWPVLTTIATTIVAFIPMFFMTGVTGKFIQEIPIIVIITLIVSLLESTIILPSHIAHGPKTTPRKLEWFEKMKKSYGKFLRKTLHHRGITFSVFVIILVSCFSLLYFKINITLFPYDDVDLFYVLAETPEGTPIEETARRMKEVEKLIQKLDKKEMVNFTTSVGHHDTNVYGANSGLHENWAMVSVFLKHSSDRDRTSKEIIESLVPELNKIKGFQKLFFEKYNDGPPVGRPITISIISKNDELRRQYAQKIFNYLETTPGVINPENDEKSSKKELRVRPDYSKMASFGITSFQVAQTLRAAFQGLVPTSITREGEEIDYRIQIQNHEDKNSETLNKIQISNQLGEMIDLKKFTRLEEGEGLELIRHYNGIRSNTITGDVDGKLMTSSKINKLVVDKFKAEIDSIPGLQIIFGGEEKATQESLQSFLWAFLCALLAIYFILILLFDSWKIPFIILAALPFGFCGVIIVFYLHNLPISFLGLIGCLGLVGIVVNDALVMVSHFKDQTKLGIHSLDAIVNGSCDRLRPVLLTTMTTVMGMVPTIYGFGGSEPFIVPIVLSISGGLLFATFITLILIPNLYSFTLSSSKA